LCKVYMYMVVDYLKLEAADFIAFIFDTRKKAKHKEAFFGIYVVDLVELGLLFFESVVVSSTNRVITKYSNFLAYFNVDSLFLTSFLKVTRFFLQINCSSCCVILGSFDAHSNNCLSIWSLNKG